jgi:hypothetical protein
MSKRDSNQEDRMTATPAIGTRIWASVVQPGMIVDLDGESFPVDATREGYDTITLVSNGREVKVPWASLLMVVGYFNP